MELRKFVAPEIIMGTGSIELTGHYAGMFGGAKVFLVTDKNVRHSYWFKEIIASLVGSRIQFSLFDEISENPRDFQIMQGAEEYKRENCDVIVAIGGGSVIDAAKGIGIVSSNQGQINDFEGVDHIQNPIPPLICVPSTCGSSADVSQFSIINHTEERRKIAIISKALVPDISLIDPSTLLTLDKNTLVSVSLDALTHAIEAYVSTASSLLTDRHAVGAIELISENLLPALSNPDNMALLSNLMYASLEAGLAFSNASLGLVHAMAHVLGGFKDYSHGVCNGLLLKNICEYNYHSCSDKYDRISSILAVSRGGKSQKGSSHLLKELDFIIDKTGVKKNLERFKLLKSECHQLAEYSLQDVCNATNPKEPLLEDVKNLYEKTFC